MRPVSVSDPRQCPGGILLTAIFPTGEIAGFFATPNDVEEYGRELHARALAGEFGKIQPYETPVLTKEQLIPIAQADRNTAENSDIEVFGVLWQVDVVARDRMRSTIETAAATNASPETSVNWILSDNSIRPSTAGDLQQVLVAYTMRLADIFQQYVAWRDGDSTEMFNYTT